MKTLTSPLRRHWLVLPLIFLNIPAVSSAEAASLNGFRSANGRPALHSDAALASLAQEHANDMARREKLDHAGFFERRARAGARAENVAFGCTDEACTIQQWINSAGHRANMLLGDIDRYGLASAVSRSGRRYWALVVGGTQRQPRKQVQRLRIVPALDPPR
jgi:uncharacterized protein YkwD